MSALHQTVNDKATLNDECGAVESAPMSEKLLRIERLVAVLDARNIQKRDRARYLADQVGSTIPYWSGLLAGARPFGERVARKLEDKLGLTRGSLEEHGMAPDTAAVAAAFDALPVDTPAALEVRKRLYFAIIGMIAASAPSVASIPGQPIAPAPTAQPFQGS